MKNKAAKIPLNLRIVADLEFRAYALSNSKEIKYATQYLIDQVHDCLMDLGHVVIDGDDESALDVVDRIKFKVRSVPQEHKPPGCKPTKGPKRPFSKKAIW